MMDNQAALLERSLPRDRLELLHLVARQASILLQPLYLVGGVVRDLLLGGAINDFDLVVAGDAIKLARALVSRYGGKVTAHTKFGTAKWILPEHLKPAAPAHEAVDIISARSETYKHPAALPTVKPGSIEDDIRRRDFTLNALAIRLDEPHFGELRDDLGGMEDLRSGIIRVQHPRSFLDDPTRMYRAVRYEKRYQFKIAEDTLALIPAARALIEKLSAQRIRHELDLMLEERQVSSMLARLDELELLSIIHPALSDFRRSKLASFKEDDLRAHDRNLVWLWWLMHLPMHEIESLNKRLHFNAPLLKALLAASALYAGLDSFAGLKPSETVERLDAYPLAAVEAVHFVVQDKNIKKVFSKYLSDWRHIKPQTTGHDLKKLGVEPGPRYTEILHRLRVAWLDGEVNSGEEEESLLKSIL